MQSDQGLQFRSRDAALGGDSEGSEQTAYWHMLFP